MTIYHIHPETGNDSTGNGTSGNPYKTTTPLNASLLAPGDLVKIAASPAPSLIGNATFTDNNPIITLASAVTANINTCDIIWVGAINVTPSVNTTTKTEGTGAANLSIAAGFTTGLVAFATTAALDYSAYQQISFHLQNNVAIASGVFEIRLCSDALGITAVNTFAIPAIAMIGQMSAITLDFGAALGANIQSVAIYALTDPGTITLIVDNILACKNKTLADSLTLSSIISKNTIGDDVWYAVKSINGASVAVTLSTPITGGNYYGVSEITSLYKREGFKFGGLGQNVIINTINDSGLENNPIVFEGGYSSDWLSVTGMTIYDGVTYLSLRGFVADGRQYCAMSNIGLVRVNAAISCSTKGFNYNNIFVAGVGSGITGYIATSNSGVNSINNYRGSGFNNGLSQASTDIILTFKGGDIVLYNGTQALTPQVNWDLENVIVRGCLTAAVSCNYSYNSKITNLSASNNAASLSSTSLHSIGNTLYFYNSILSDTIEYSKTGRNVCEVYSHNHDQITGYDKAFFSGVNLDNDTTTVNTPGGKSARITFTDTTTRDAFLPFKIPIGKLALKAGSSVIINIKAYRSVAGVTAKLIALKNSDLGLSSDVSVDITPSVDVTWQTSGNISFTPTNDGILDLELQAWTTSVSSILYLDDLAVA